MESLEYPVIGCDAGQKTFLTLFGKVSPETYAKLLISDRFKLKSSKKSQRGLIHTDFEKRKEQRKQEAIRNEGGAEFSVLSDKKNRKKETKTTKD